MPTYDYECAACRHRFERFQSITAKPVRTCPRCGKRRVKRLIGHGAAVIFRGSGFYATDYRGDSYRKAAEKDTPPASGSSSKDASAPKEGGGKAPEKGGGKTPEKGGS